MATSATLNGKLKLEPVSMEYFSFTENQVLTHTQLNQVIEFFEDQNRLTRTCLMGVGLVCGLHVKYFANTQTIRVRSGCAVTTDGDLVKFKETDFTHYRLFNNERAHYEPFWPGGIQMKLWQLEVPGEDGQYHPDAKLLSNFNSDPEKGDELKNMIAILYLEYYLKPKDKCSAIDCDNLGDKQVAKPMILLLKKSDVDLVINAGMADANNTPETIYDTIYSQYHPAYVSYFDQVKIIQPKRVFLDDDAKKNMESLANAYKSIVQQGANVVAQSIAFLYTTFKFKLDPGSFFDMGSIRVKLLEQLNKDVSPQYLYDFYKDVVVAYNELREILYNISSECCPNVRAFPKHIMLGEMNVEYGERLPDYRHQWYPSPAHSKNKVTVNVAIGMLKRLKLLIENFRIPAVDEVKITPSQDYDKALQERAIPFYYDRENVGKLAEEWNYGRTLRNQFRTTLGYFSHKYDDYDAATGKNEFTRKPLDFNIDSNNFYRIEGHIGKTFKEALQIINDLRRGKNIGFDIQGVRLGKANLEDVDVKDYECQFDDLKVMLEGWMAEQACLIATVVRFFSAFGKKKDQQHLGERPKKPALTGDLTMSVEAKMKTKMLDKSRSTTFLFSSQPIETKYAATNSFETLQPEFQSGKIELAQEFDLRNDSTGVYMMTEFFKGGSTEDIILRVQEKFRNDPDLKEMEADDRELQLEIPLRVIAETSAMSRFAAHDLNELTKASLFKYMIRSRKFCDAIHKLHGRASELFSAKKGTAARRYESRYMWLLGLLISNCCAWEQLEIILKEIIRRKKKILEYLSFANYAEHHPGLEHKAGVHRGGTFVLVYRDPEQKNDEKTERFNEKEIEQAFDIAEKYFAAFDKKQDATAAFKAAKLDQREVATYVMDDDGDLDRMAKSIYSGDKKNDKKVLASFMVANQLRKGESDSVAIFQLLQEAIMFLGGKPSDTDNERVVADFCLPYICCSDCPPVAYIIPKPKLALVLKGGPQFCGNDGNYSGYPFIPEPSDGVVTAADNTLQQAGVVVLENGKYFFNPSKVPVEKYAQVLNFQVNGQATACTATVFKHPQAEILVTEFFEDAATVSFKIEAANSNEVAEGFIYDWVIDQVGVRSGKGLHLIEGSKLNLQGDIITTDLTITNQICSFKLTAGVHFKPYIKAGLSIDPDTVCSLSQSNIPFSAEPPDALIVSDKVPAEAITQASEGNPATINLSKIPAELFGTSITFRLKDFDASCTLLITEPVLITAHAKIIFQEGNEFIVLIENTTNTEAASGKTFIWNFSEGNIPHETFENNSLEVKFSRKEISNDAVIVLVTVKEDPCQSNAEFQVELPSDNKCVNQRTKVYLELLSVVNSGKVLSALEESGSGELNDAWQKTFTLIQKGGEATSASDELKKKEIAHAILELVKSLLELQVNNAGKFVTGRLLLALTELLFEMYHCNSKLDNVLDIIKNLVGLIKENFGKIKENFQQMDVNDELSNYLGAYSDTYKSKPLLESELEILLAMLKKF